MNKMFLTICCLFLCKCSKIIDLTNENINKISYIKPDNCEIDNIKINKYQTTIINDKITLDNNNLENFLKNFYNYNFSIKKYIICLKNNNTYYENIIKELIKD